MVPKKEFETAAVNEPSMFEPQKFYCNSYNILTLFLAYEKKCQGGNKYALPITAKFDQSNRRLGRISNARLFKFTEHNALLCYRLPPSLCYELLALERFRY